MDSLVCLLIGTWNSLCLAKWHFICYFGRTTYVVLCSYLLTCWCSYVLFMSLLCVFASSCNFFNFYTFIMLWLHMQLYFLLCYCIASCFAFTSIIVMRYGTRVMYWMCCLSGTSGVVYPLNVQWKLCDLGLPWSLF